MRLNSIVAKMVLGGRDPSNLELHEVLNEIVLNFRRKFNFTIEILGNFALMKKQAFSAISIIQNLPIKSQLNQTKIT